MPAVDDNFLADVGSTDDSRQELWCSDGGPFEEENRTEATEETTYHHHRRAALAKSSEDLRPALAKIMVSALACREAGVRCGNPACSNKDGAAVVRCKDCHKGGIYLCRRCDLLLHPLAHKHRRHIWTHGFLDCISPTEEINCTGALVEVQKIFGNSPAECVACGQNNWSPAEATN